MWTMLLVPVDQLENSMEQLQNLGKAKTWIATTSSWKLNIQYQKMFLYISLETPQNRTISKAVDYDYDK